MKQVFWIASFCVFCIAFTTVPRNANGTYINYVFLNKTDDSVFNSLDAFLQNDSFVLAQKLEPAYYISSFNTTMLVPKKANGVVALNESRTNILPKEWMLYTSQNACADMTITMEFWLKSKNPADTKNPPERKCFRHYRIKIQK